jgi:hypothetical protein
MYGCSKNTYASHFNCAVPERKSWGEKELGATLGSRRGAGEISPRHLHRGQSNEHSGFGAQNSASKYPRAGFTLKLQPFRVGETALWSDKQDDASWGVFWRRPWITAIIERYADIGGGECG